MSHSLSNPGTVTTPSIKPALSHVHQSTLTAFERDQQGVMAIQYRRARFSHRDRCSELCGLVLRDRNSPWLATAGPKIDAPD
ncbi:MAG: hypothetical protein JMN24_16620 [gamma proteobacterium endosymbiont of Lamellibrachia anaximandri]|nr:hypothetical protein [gamma proteobacterium endosymbiont of Lamellibrachia anaximandri]